MPVHVALLCGMLVSSPVPATAGPAGQDVSGSPTRFCPDQAPSLQVVHDWVDVAFDRPRSDAPSRRGIYVVRSRRPVQKNRNVWGGALSLGGNTYEQGIYMDSPALVRVLLDQAAVRFTASVGIDDNRDTRRKPEAGSARFHVWVGGERRFSSPVIRVAFLIQSD